MNPFLGVFFHWLGGLASGSFYVPYRFVKRWSWETYWLAGGFFSWIIAPWVLGSILTNDLPVVIREAPASCLFWSYFWGAMWGLGGLTFGLTMRYLGMSLGMAVALGYCAAFGTLMPPIYHDLAEAARATVHGAELPAIVALISDGKFATEVLHTQSGHVILFGVAVCLAGIAVTGLAGMSKEREMSEEQKKLAIKEFSFKKGLLVATFSGVMSASFSYGLAAGDPIKAITVEHGTASLWQGLPVLVIVLLGGFTTNFIWCLLLNIKNQTGYQYFSATTRNNSPGRNEVTIIETAIDAPSEEVVEHIPRARTEPSRVPMLSNYFFCALAGTTWYFQFFFYTMGETQMGKYKFSSWTLHMASIIIFSTLWGIALSEWKGSSRRTIALVTAGLMVLVASTIIVGYGNYLGTLPGAH
jgi:L-rhamnose-H+ transport protein